GETPDPELLKLAGDGEEPAVEPSSEFPIESSIGLLAKGLTTLTSEMQTLKAGKYPYPDKEKDKEEEEEKKKGPTTADVLTAIEKLTTSVAKLASLQSAVAKASTEKQETEEEAAARKKKEEEEEAAKKEKEKETVKLSADGTPEEIKAAEETSESDIDELVKAQVDKRLEETLQRMGFLKSGASVIPIGSVQRPGLLSKGEERDEMLQDMEKLSQLSFRQINKYRSTVQGFSRN
ncbi:unnamed protein product, partial [marine sediment metagenome]